MHGDRRLTCCVLGLGRRARKTGITLKYTDSRLCPQSPPQTCETINYNCLKYKGNNNCVTANLTDSRGERYMASRAAV